MKSKGQVDEAIACWRKAIELEPKTALAHLNLGTALKAKGQLDEAIACYRKAIEIDSNLMIAHFSLGNSLSGKGQLDEAIACYRKVIELNPKFAEAHCNLGILLFRKGQVDDTIACFRKAIELDPKLANAYCNLGAVLPAKGHLDEAITCCRKAIELDPKLAEAHKNLGLALRGKGQLDEAIACFRKAIELNPKSTSARTNLARAQQLAAARDKLPVFLKGEFQPTTNDERLALAEWCQIKKLHHAATRVYAAAFAADPKLADDLRVQNRYNAACLAALAAAGQGEDAAKLNDAEYARLRKQAHDWLRADLALWARQAEASKPAGRAEVQRALSHWQTDADLAGIRDAAALAKLPADEQTAFTQLWSDVAALLKKAETK